MKSKTIRPLALISTITAFAAGSAFAATYQWKGTTDSVWATASNWDAQGVAATGVSAAHRLNVNNASANKAIYTAALGTTVYANTGGRGLVIGSGTLGSGTMNITGGTFSTLGSRDPDILGNTTGNSGTLNIDGGNFISTNAGLDVGLGFGTTALLSVKNGSATIANLKTNNTTATINLETGGTLSMNQLVYGGGGANIFNFNGGTLTARTPSTAFIATPTNGSTTLNVKSGGAVIDTDSFDITIARPLLEDALSTGGGITKNSAGILTLGAVSTTTGAAVVNAGGLAVAAGINSWQPSSFTHSGTQLNFNLGVYNPSNVAAINTPSLTLNSAITVNVSGSQVSIGQIPLLAYGSKSGTGSLTLGTLPAGVAATLVDDGSQIYLDVTQGVFVWSGDSGTPGTGDWDSSSDNWNNFTLPYSNPSPVTFPTITGGGTVNVTANFSPLYVDFTNTLGDDYILEGAGKITGASLVNKTGTGTVSLNNTNDYSGNTTVTAGVLSIGTTAALPGWNANNRYPVSNGATLAVQNAVSNADIATMLATTGNLAAGANIGFDVAAGDRAYPDNITGTIGVTALGANALTLSGANNYTGATRVPSGTLKAGSSTAFAGTSQLALSGTGTFDLNGFDAVFASNTAGSVTNTITSSAAGTGTDTLKINGGNTSFTGLVEDGASRKVAVKVTGNNANNAPNNGANTYSGGLTLLGALAPAPNGARMLPFEAAATVDGNGDVISGPYGTGTITIGEAATDKVQVYFQVANRTIDNDIVVNSAVGTDTAGAFRVESGGHTINGAIQANLASAVFRNHVSGGSSGVGFITLTGPISTGTEPTAGLSVIAAGANGLTVTLFNEGVTANSYTGNTAINGINATMVLGAAEQIPSGSGTGNVVFTNSGKLDLAGFDETINGLSGIGTIDNITEGLDNTLTIGDGDATGLTFSGSIFNTNNILSLVKTGSGTQTLSGTNNYGGTTTVSGGTLLINGDQSAATGAVTVENTATLGGNGSIGGATTVAAGGTLAPGAVGVVDLLDITDSATITGTLACDVSGATTDQITVAGDLTLSGPLSINQVAPATPGTYVIATYSGNRSGTFNVTSLPSGYSVNYDDANNEVELVIAAPGGYAAWASSNSVAEGENGDDDKDGITNLVEYALGLDPQVSSTPAGTFNGNTLTFVKGTEAKAAGDLTYSIETSTTLLDGSWSAAAAIETANDISFTLPSGQGKIFGRLKVVK